MPKISCIVSTYNRAKILPRIINSIINQTEKDWELIIVDDGSTDDTPKVLEHYNRLDKRIKYVIVLENSGDEEERTGKEVQPINMGISIATGKYICHVDDDEMFYPDKFKAMSVILDHNADIDVVYCDEIVSRVSEGIHYITRERSKHFDKEALMKYNYIGLSDGMYRRKVLEKVGTFPGGSRRFNRTACDWEFWKLLVKLGCKFFHLPLVLEEGYSIASSPHHWEADKKPFELTEEILRKKLVYFIHSMDDPKYYFN